MSDERPKADSDGEWEPPPVPFSFKLTLVLLALYLGYRLVQLVMCVPSFFGRVDCPYL